MILAVLLEPGMKPVTVLDVRAVNRTEVSCCGRVPPLKMYFRPSPSAPIPMWGSHLPDVFPGWRWCIMMTSVGSLMFSRLVGAMYCTVLAIYIVQQWAAFYTHASLSTQTSTRPTSRLIGYVLPQTLRMYVTEATGLG